MCVTVVIVRKHGRMHVSHCCSAESVYSVVFSDDHALSLKGTPVFLYLPGFAGKRHVQFYQAALLTRHTCSTCVLCLFCCFRIICSTSLCRCNVRSVSLGSCVSLNNVPTVCNVVFTPYILLVFCIVGRKGYFQSVTFPVGSRVATAYRLGTRDTDLVML